MTQAGQRSQLIGRGLITLAILMYGVVPPLVDFTATDVLHPDWTPHSRMHMVWLVVTNSAIAAVALCLLWSRGGHRGISAVLSLCVLGGFFVSAAAAPLYGGALHDQGGVAPVMGIDANLLGFSTALLLLLVGIFLSRPTSRQA